MRVLGVLQIIRGNPEIINKTDSQNRNIILDLKQLNKNSSSIKVIKSSEVFKMSFRYMKRSSLAQR